MRKHPAKMHRVGPRAIVLLCCIVVVAGRAAAQSTTRQSPLTSGSQPSIEAKLDPRDAPGSMFQGPVHTQLPSELGAEGYCLVTLRDERKWIEGDPRARAVFGNKLYLFADARKRDIFVAKPNRYLPVLDGDCLVTYSETGERAAGRVEFGMSHQGRLFFFVDKEHLERFQQQPQKYLTADLVEKGFCIVSKVDEKRLVPGIPETVAILDGLRYFFASAYHRKIFATNPLRYGAEVNASLDATKIVSPKPKQAKPGEKPAADQLAETEKSTESEEKKKEFRVSARPVMSGYCPVSIRTRGVWIRGKSKFKTVYDGKTYNLAGAEELTDFQQDPLAYVPVLGGDSVVSLVEQLVRKEGKVHHVGYYGDRLYLFVSSEEKAAFEANPELYANADLAFGGHCMVTQVEEKKQVPGLLQFETLYHGLRYRFSSEEKMKRFLESPTKFAEP